MSIWIKICGNTSLEDTQLAVKAGADAVGFVFAPSPRQVTVPEAASIVKHLASQVEKIGVFVDAPLDDIYSAVRLCGLTGVQLHSAAGPEMPAKLREHLGSDLKVLRVVHFDADAADRTFAEIAEHDRNPHVDAVLVDSRTATAVGGTGVRFDWVAARSIFSTEAKSCKRIVAGGLNAENVAEAIATLQPSGVDVVSGVEAAPGHKDPFKVRAFVDRARAAAKLRRSREAYYVQPSEPGGGGVN
jgi:phosphoribosylanthranilate isomerase